MREPGRPRLPAGIATWGPAALVATWFGAGLLRPAPGTWGSLAALPFALAVALLAGPWGLVAAAALLFAAGLWVTHLLVRRIGEGEDIDLPSIVVDEVAGQMLALAPAALSPTLWLAAFFFFRVFDMWKPWPIRTLERRIAGPLGVMIDDIAAGLAAGAAVAFLAWLGVGDV